MCLVIQSVTLLDVETVSKGLGGMDQEKSSERLCERDKLRRWRLTRERDGG